MTTRTPEDLLKALKAMGIDPGDWVEAGGKVMEPPFIQRQKGHLLKFKEILEQQVADDQEALAKLHQKKSRLLHGGGS